MMKYNENVAIAFLKDLEKAKVIKKGSYKNEDVVDCIVEIINMTEDEVRKESTTANNFYNEFTDWIETHKVEAI